MGNLNICMGTKANKKPVIHISEGNPTPLC